MYYTNTKRRFLRSERNFIIIKWPSSTKFLFDVSVTCPKHSSTFTFCIFTGIQLQKHQILLLIRCSLLLAKVFFPDITAYSFRYWDARHITKIRRPLQELYQIYYLLYNNRFIFYVFLLYIYVSSSCQLAFFAYPDWEFSVLFPQL